MNEINISLLNVKFNSHFQSGIKLKIVHDPNRDFKIVLTSENCSDTCISGVWPKSNFTWEDGRVKVLEFSIGPKENSSQKNNIMNLISTTKSLFQRCGGYTFFDRKNARR